MGLFVIGWVIAAQVFAESMNYDPSIVGYPTNIYGYDIYSILVYLAAVVKHLMYPDFQVYIYNSFVPIYISLGIGILFVFIWGIIRMINASKRNIHGTARFANKKDLKHNGLLVKDDGVILAQLDSAKVKADKKNNTALTLHLKKQAPFIQHSGKANTLLLAPTGSGKGVGVLNPTLLNYKGSMIVFDPKGELYNITAGYRKTFSRVIRFSPLSNFTARYNPVMAISDDDDLAFAEADLIASSFFSPPKQNADATAEYFNNKARDLVVTTLLHIRFCPDIPIENKNLAFVLSYLSQVDLEAMKRNAINPQAQQENDDQGKEQFMAMINAHHYIDAPVYEIIEDIDERGKKKLDKNGKAMTKKVIKKDSDGIVIRKKRKAENIHRIIQEGAMRAISINSREKATVFSSVFSKLQLFSDPLLKQATAESDFEIEDFIESDKPITLYLTVPYSDIQRISPVFKVLISFMIKKLSTGETQHGSIRLKHHLIFLLDEFPVLGYFPDIAQVMGVLRGYGINFIIVCQALSQLIDIYGQNHPFLDHCTVQIVYAPGSTKDAEEFSNAIGNETYKEMKISSSGKAFGGSSNLNFNDNVAGRRLLDVADLKRLGADKCLVLAHGMQPYLAKKCVFYEDTRFKEKLLLIAPQNLKEMYQDMAHLPSVKRKKKEYLKLMAKKALLEQEKNAPDNFKEFKGRSEKMEGEDLFDTDLDIFSDYFDALENQLLKSAQIEDDESDKENLAVF